MHKSEDVANFNPAYSLAPKWGGVVESNPASSLERRWVDVVVSNPGFNQAWVPIEETRWAGREAAPFKAFNFVVAVEDKSSSGPTAA